VIRLDKGEFGTYVLVDTSTGDSQLVQTDWDFPAVAIDFGFVPCDQCDNTDGTVNCEHKTASQMISEARDFLDEHIGDEIRDPGYFS
jgi:hypothetical protein